MMGDIPVIAYHTPCHTKGAFCYLIDGHLFTGDTLFLGGCGKFFEGTAADMLRNLDLISAFPEDTLIHPGHDYTAKNLRFGLTIESNPAIQQRLESLDENSSVEATLKIELMTNVFLRTSKFIGSYGHNSEEVLGKLRSLKDSYKE